MKNKLLLILCCLPFMMEASHITGGSLSYRHLGNNNYELNLEILRDCNNGIPFFDDPASVGVFLDGTLFAELYIPLSNLVDTISILPENTVCIFPESVCIDRALYSDTIYLPANASNYILAYQRCCFSAQLSNIIDPVNIGFTIHTEINANISNSSPVFPASLPVTTFINIPFIYDASISDPDGDSLVYQLSTPFAGASPMQPIPQPPMTPPYSAVDYLEPTFSVDNMLGGNYPLTIDSESGEMTAIPTLLGLFEVAYTIEEYRNGQFIGSTQRAFTFYTNAIDQATTFDVNGTVRIENLSPLDFGNIQLLERDISTDSLHLVTEKSINSNGTYSFVDVDPGVYYLRAFTTPQSMYHGDYLPTYYRSDLFWYDANAVSQCDTSEFYRDVILLSSGESQSGNESLAGYIVNEIDESPATNVNILLLDEMENILAYATTNNQGYFQFPNLSTGNYLLYVDLLNSGIDNSNPPLIQLTESQTYDFLLYDEVLEVTGLTGIENIEEERVFEIYPNPSSGKINLTYDAPPADSKVNIEVFNVLGKKEWSQEINTSTGQNSQELNLQAGVHIVVVTIDGKVSTERVFVY